MLLRYPFMMHLRCVQSLAYLYVLTSRSSTVVRRETAHSRRTNYLQILYYFIAYIDRNDTRMWLMTTGWRKKMFPLFDLL